ncbi:MAG: tetratricopeptide repeat protein [Rhizobacter sp.]|nr:tetratricopeptide repeat protein [Burkholderiaceae bacterium]MCO5123606.1 tetratricopeptide repeat protein [Rhizobacter sp.]
MPARIVRSVSRSALVLAAACCGLAPAAHAQDAQSPPVNSALTAPLFYQLLIGEIELSEGSPGNAYQVILDAARKTNDQQLYRRATDIALQARAGDQALAAVKAWRGAWPDSRDALRYQVQLLIALNRVPEAVEPLQRLIDVSPPAERPLLISVAPRLFARAADKRAAAKALEDALGGYVKEPATATAARVAIARGWLLAQDTALALELTQQAHAADPSAEGPALVALEMLPTTPQAEAIVTATLAANPGNNAVRMLYARVLGGGQRHADAIAQLEIVARNAPTLAAPWLSLGALHLELRQPQEATTALKKFVQLAQAADAPAASASAPAASAAQAAPSAPAASAARPLVDGTAQVDDEDDDDDAPSTSDAGLIQAYLLLAQAAEMQGDYAQAETWLGKIDSTTRALEVQVRRASLLARQGRIDEARAVIRQTPERNPADVRAKLLAEAQILREAKRWDDAYAVMAAANKQFPNDPDLLYEQAMLAEKLGRFDDMERELRRVIEIAPNFQHAYNALGYSLAERNVRLEEARALIKKALEIRPGDPFITDSLGWVEYRMGNREEAVRLLRQAYGSRPDVEIAVHLAEVLWVSGQRDEARQILRDARKRDASNEVLVETIARLQVDL